MNISVWSADGRRVVAIPYPVRRKVLVDLPALPGDPRPLRAIQAAVCGLWGIKPQQLTGESRCMDFVYPRWAAMLFASERLAWSTPRIGRALGDRDHTTVMHGINRAKELLADRRQPFTELYRQLEESL